jgi:prolyl-tRNA editing enzyme YbaK/EbsC (Cys-tRNA(Pro) deacylase)
VTQKTNAARLLDQMGIQCELREYESDPEDLQPKRLLPRSACRPGNFSKTLVAHGDRHGICS